MSVRNASGESVDGGVVKIPDAPNAPTIGTVTDVGTGRAYNNGAVTVAFTPAGYWDSTYTATSTPGSLTGTGSSSPVTVTGLSSQTSYTFTAKSANVNNVSGPSSGASSSVTATTVPQAPTIGTFTDGGNGSTGTLSFTAGATGGKNITDYKWSTDNVTYTALGSTTSPLTVGGLSAGTYTFYLKAVNANGDSAASTGVSGTVIQPSSFESIATATLSVDTTTISFTSIPQTYTSLQLRIMAKHASAGIGFQSINATLNENWTSSFVYASHTLRGNGTTTSAYALAPDYAYIDVGVIYDSSSGYYGATIIDIQDYNSTTKNKTVRSLSGQDLNGSGYLYMSSGMKQDTNALTSIYLKVEQGSRQFSAGSTFALYGIKGA